MKVFKNLSIIMIIILCISSLAFADSNIVERKSTLNLEVPLEVQEEVTAENYIDWQIENEDIVYFTSIDDFTATIMGFNYGETTVTCLQGGNTIATWQVTVPDTSAPLKQYQMILGKRYMVSESSITETEQESFSMHMSSYRSLVFSPSDYIEVLDYDPNQRYIVNAISEGTFTVSTKWAMAGSGPLNQRVNGHYKYSNGGKFNWVDPVWEVTIITPGFKGDVNSDGHLNIIDVKLLLQTVISDIILLSPEDFERMDINGDENLNIIDVKLLLQQCIALINQSN